MTRFVFLGVFLAVLVTLPTKTFSACEPIKLPSNLKTSPGFMEFMTEAQLSPLKKVLPKVENTEIQNILESADTMWYDEGSMVFLYQDSVEVVVGARANCVGRKTGEDNPEPIGKLKNLFGPDYRFRFPFRTAAGTDDIENSRVINFWAPPKKDGKVLPVKWWRNGSRGRWNWVFPVGTVFGEVLYQKAPDGNYYTYEIRMRKRYLDGWDANLFRPFVSADDLAMAIATKRPDWKSSENLSAVINHLQTKTNLAPITLTSSAFSKVFPAVKGYLDYIPNIDDSNLVIELLTQTPFKSTQGKIWKENAGQETYGPSSLGNFSIAPKGYKMGVFQNNEVSCARCHQNTGHAIQAFDDDLQLYGEVWGEDRIFTWHLFLVQSTIFGTYDDADFPASRVINPRMVQAQLLMNQKPAQGDPLYKQLPQSK